MAQPFPLVVESLLNAADTSARERAWSNFLAEYNKLILHICHALGGDYDAVMDRYAFVVEQLGHADCRCLRAYKTTGTGKFTTWFTVVVRRICLDEYRKRYGRRQATTRAADEQRDLRRDLTDLVSAEVDVTQIAGSAALPDAIAAASELREAVHAAVSRLCTEDRLILRFRFEQDLSVPEIARLIGADSAFHVYRRLDKLFSALREELGHAGLSETVG
jgi:RNA polymerase sigma factor (sigma-70 family)